MLILGYLVGIDVIAVIACLVTEILSIGFIILYGTIWLVAGIFCGLLAYNAAASSVSTYEEGDWTGGPDASKAGLIALAMGISIIVALSMIFYRLFWQGSSSENVYVPDSMAMSLIFFISIVLSMVFGHTLFRPKPSK